MTSQEKLAASWAMMEKQAIFGAAVKGAVGNAGKWLANKVGQRTFTSGLAAPVSKLYGGVQKLYGRGQQAVAGLTNNQGLYNRGASNLMSGTAQRGAAGLRSGLQAPNPWSYRMGRGVGMAAIGAPLAMSSMQAATLAGANSVDPAVVAEYAKGQAHNRVNSRMQEFTNMPFMDRLRTAMDPSEFTNNILSNSAEFQGLNNDMQNGPPTAPGMMGYMASFNPLLGRDPIKQQVLYNMFNKQGAYIPALMAKEATGMGAIVRGAGSAGWQALKGWGRNALGKVQQKIPGTNPLNAITNKGQGTMAMNRAKKTMDTLMNPAAPLPQPSVGQSMVGKGVYNAIANPFKTTLGVGGAALTPYMLASSYGNGQSSVYDNAVNAANGMADYQFTQQFAQPGMMGMGQRMMGAVMPGFAANYVNQQTGNSLYQGQ